MYILLDTNIYFNNWFLKSPSFAKLIHYCNEADATLLVPEVVVAEVQAKFKEESEKALKHLDETRRLCESVGYGGALRSADIGSSPYSFRDIVIEKVMSPRFLTYDGVPHRLLVSKAIGAKRPFTDGEKGYRDALMWHSLVDFLKNERSGTSVAFVSDNYTDFFDGKSEPPRFYGDLDNDLRDAGVQNRFLLFRSLRQFLDTNKVFTNDGIDQERFRGEFLSTLESAAKDIAIDYLNSMSVAESKKLFADAGFSPRAVPFMLATDWEIWEDTEDPQIASTELLDNDKAYVSYTFNLRNMICQWTVRGPDYLFNKDVFDSAFWNAKGDDEFIHLETGARCYFEASFIVDVRRGETIEASIDKVWLREYGQS